MGFLEDFVSVRWGIALLCCLTLPSVPALAAWESEPQITLSTTSVRPGETLRLSWEGVPPTMKANVVWRGKMDNGDVYKAEALFFPLDKNNQRALLGVPLGAAPGDYTLEARVIGSEDLQHDMAWTVAPRQYTLEDIHFSKNKTSLLKDKQEKKETRVIRKAFREMTPEQLWKGVFILPVDGPVVGEFGVRRMANGKTPRGYHRGTDLKAPQGTPIRAANSGIVRLVRPYIIHGNTVVIDHGQGVMTLYLHLSKFRCKEGQRVASGDIIGEVGSTGLSTAPHVHWGLYIKGVCVDPLAWTKQEF